MENQPGRCGQGESDQAHEIETETEQVTTLFERWSLEKKNGDSATQKVTIPVPIIDYDKIDPKKQKNDSKDESCKLVGNFIKLKTNDDKRIFQYTVTFNPKVEYKQARHKLLRQFPEVLGKSPTYDGNRTIFLPVKLAGLRTSLEGRNPYEASENVIIELTFRQTVRIDETRPFWDALFFQFFDILGYRQMNEKFYCPKKKIWLNQHKISYEPGVTSFVRYTDVGLMVGLNLCHMVQRRHTIYDTFEHLRSFCVDYKEKFFDYVMGRIAVTSYDNICHPIDDISWEMTPQSRFMWGSKEVTYTEHFRLQYNIKVEDQTQPLLLCRSGFKETGPVFEAAPRSAKLLPLIPELCFVTGLTDDRKNRKRILFDLAEHTMHSPNHRITSLLQLMKILKANEQCVAILQLWGLEIGDDFVEMDGHIVPGPTLQFTNLTLHDAPQDFTKTALSNRCYHPIPIKRWLVFCVPSDKKAVLNMIDNYITVARTVGIPIITEGEIVEVKVDGIIARPEEFRSTIKEHVVVQETQFIIVVLPQNCEEVYEAVKVLCLLDLGIPSQVILSSKLRDQHNVRSIMERVVPQINCKLGGSLWALKVPTHEAIMFVGMDTFHDPKKFRRSVHGMVASLNTECTHYYSRATIQPFYQEVCFTLKPTFIRALQAYREECHKLPDRIIVFRDGVSSGQFDNIVEFEVKAMLEAIQAFGGTPPKFCFMIVQKRIWERVFSNEQSIISNPRIGTVADNTITKPNMTDFYLVSQTLSQGTVKPLHCVVLEDCGEDDPRLFQKLAHISAFMYYNWPGSIRTPAMCQYAHRIASFVGTHLRDEPKIGSEMEKKLYYL